MAIHIAYIAGIFDGEGTVGIYSTQGTAPSPVLAVAGGHLPMLEAIHDHFGFGSVFLYDQTQYNDGVHRAPQTGRWQVRTWEGAVTVLTELRPYLMEKAEQADVFLAAAAARPGRGRRHTDESRRQMEESAMTLRRLKKPHRYLKEVS